MSIHTLCNFLFSSPILFSCSPSPRAATWETRGFNTSTVDHNITGLPALYPYSITLEVPVYIVAKGPRKTGENCWPAGRTILLR